MMEEQMIGDFIFCKRFVKSYTIIRMFLYIMLL